MHQIFGNIMQCILQQKSWLSLCLGTSKTLNGKCTVWKASPSYAYPIKLVPSAATNDNIFVNLNDSNAWHAATLFCTMTQIWKSSSVQENGCKSCWSGFTKFHGRILKALQKEFFKQQRGPRTVALDNFSKWRPLWIIFFTTAFCAELSLIPHLKSVVAPPSEMAHGVQDSWILTNIYISITGTVQMPGTHTYTAKSAKKETSRTLLPQINRLKHKIWCQQQHVYNEQKLQPWL